MKLGLFIIGLLLTQNVLAAGQSQLSCKGSGHTQLNIGSNESNKIGYLVHNYSTANVACPFSISEFLENTVKMRCYGSWTYDHTPAWVEVTKTARQITAIMQTNRFYGHQIKNMNCTLTTTERQ